MIPVTNLRNGTCFSDECNLYQVLTYEHVKMGRGSATIRVKIKNLKSGATTIKSFISGAKVREAIPEKRDLQYLYSNETVKQSNNRTYVFMDPVTFEQFEISEEKIRDQAAFLQEGMTVKIMFYQNEPLTIQLPIKMPFKIKETESGYKGNSATNIFKDAILENGLKLKVPLFVQIGDQIVVDTRTGVYVERV